MLFSYSEGTEELAETGFQLALAYTRAASQDKDAESKLLLIILVSEKLSVHQKGGRRWWIQCLHPLSG